MTRKSKQNLSQMLRATLGATVAAGLGAFGFTSSAHAGEHMLVLIDQSGSMFDTSVAGAPRYQVARSLASMSVAAAAANREYALWTFSGSTFTSIVPLAAGASQADILAAIASLPPPGGSTPLAGSICDAVDELVAYKPTELHDKRIELFSDGLENSTPTTHECYGPPSADHAHPDVGSWEWKVFNKARTGSAASSAHPPIPLIVNTDYLFDNEVAVFAAFAPVRSSGVAKIGRLEIEVGPIDLPEIARLPRDAQVQVIEKLRVQIPSSIVRSQVMERVEISEAIRKNPAAEALNTVNFYQELTAVAGAGAGGRYREFSSTTPRLPQLGDVTGDYCVDDDDVAAIKANFGAHVAAGNLLDPNQDKVIDRYDYNTVLQNYGAGCKG